jgi:two-component system, OmpR family, response regulator
VSAVAQQKRVLIVDDEPTIREVIAEALHEAGFEIRTASNGAEGLEILREWLADAIVLDLMMPRLDGLGFVELLRLTPRVAGVPVLLVTAAYSAQRAAEHARVQAMLSKPFELDVLVEMVRQLAGAPPTPPPDEPGRRHISASPPPETSPGFAAGDS